MKVPFGGENILLPVDLVEIEDPKPNTPEYEAALQRDKTTRSIDAMPWLPQLPDEWAHSIYERIEAAERQYIAPNLQKNEYTAGTATRDDDVMVIQTKGNARHLFTAEHATKPTRIKTAASNPDADYGTGGLAVTLAEDYGQAIILTGRQTAKKPSDPTHNVRQPLEMALPSAKSLVSLHGKVPGMFVHPDDRSEIHACLGMGSEPSESLIEFAKKIVLAARDDLGLYVVMSNFQPAYIQHEKSTELKKREDGSLKRSQMAGLSKNSMVNVARAYLQGYGVDRPLLQLEITRLLRLDPNGRINADKKSFIMGVALGYKLVEKIVQLVPEYGKEQKD